MELGNIFIELGHEFTIYTSVGLQPNWSNTVAEAVASGLDSYLKVPHLPDNNLVA